MYLGIDPSLNSTGYYLLDKAGKRIFSGIIRQGPEDGYARLTYLYKAIRVISRKVEVKFCCIEGFAFSRHSSSTYQLGEASGVIKLAIVFNAIPFVIVTPNQVKKFGTNKGNCKKPLVMEFFEKEVGRKPLTSDEADSYYLAQVARAYSLWPRTEYLTDYQSKVILTIKTGDLNGWGL